MNVYVGGVFITVFPSAWCFFFFLSRKGIASSVSPPGHRPEGSQRLSTSQRCPRSTWTWPDNCACWRPSHQRDPTTHKPTQLRYLPKSIWGSKWLNTGEHWEVAGVKIWRVVNYPFAGEGRSRDVLSRPFPVAWRMSSWRLGGRRLFYICARCQSK